MELAPVCRTVKQSHGQQRVVFTSGDMFIYWLNAQIQGPLESAVPRLARVPKHPRNHTGSAPTATFPMRQSHALGNPGILGRSDAASPARVIVGPPQNHDEFLIWGGLQQPPLGASFLDLLKRRGIMREVESGSPAGGGAYPICDNSRTHKHSLTQEPRPRSPILHSRYSS